MHSEVIVIGAGFGGLAAALELAQAGVSVAVLEAQALPGGCASTFYHQGYRFDAGATVPMGFKPGALMDLLASHWGLNWDAQLVERGMVVHLPDGTTITRFTNSERWQAERMRAFGKKAEDFWQWQEETAEQVWDLGARNLRWPPQTLADLEFLLRQGAEWAKIHWAKIPTLGVTAFRSIGSQAPSKNARLNSFLDAQLLISAQALADESNALYGAVALDISRQGIAHVPGGIGSLADKMVNAIRQAGGKVIFHQEVEAVQRDRSGGFYIRSRQGNKKYISNEVIFNLPPWNIARILQNPPRKIKRLSGQPKGWGAYMLYLGVEDSVIPPDFPLHHQLVLGEVGAELNTLFVSISPAWDASRAPDGMRAITVSAHTHLSEWWRLLNEDRNEYETRKSLYAEKIIDSLQTILPVIKAHVHLCLPGTPVTFQRFTRREAGWVGGFPQTDLFRAWGPRLAKGVWMVGDSIFPGQSVPAVATGGMRVAQQMLAEQKGAVDARRDLVAEARSAPAR